MKHHHVRPLEPCERAVDKIARVLRPLPRQQQQRVLRFAALHFADRAQEEGEGKLKLASELRRLAYDLDDGARP